MNIVMKKFEEFNVYELYEVLRMRCEIFIVEQKCAYQDIDGADLESYHLIGVENEEICAYLRIPFKGVTYDKTSIGRVIVPEDSRGNGYAKKIILKAIEVITKEMGESEIEISAQLYLKEFYESLGFKVSSATYLEDEIPHIHMNYVK